MTRGRPKKIKVEEEIKSEEVIKDEILNAETITEIIEPEVTPKKPKEYPIPVTKEDLLALHKCLKDMGVNSTSDLEVRASKI